MRLRMTAVKNAVVILLVNLLCWQVCFAQVDPWERVKLIEPGKKVSVKLLSGQTVNGRMEAWSADGLSVRQGKDKLLPLAQPTIAQVAMVTGMSRGRKALYAGVITGGITGGLTAAACASSYSYCDFPAVGIFAIVAGFWGGVAAGIAALFPPHKEVIYTAPGGSSRGDSVQ